MKTSTNGINFIKMEENAPLARSTDSIVRAYGDAGGAAIGYGCAFFDLLTRVKFGRARVRIGDTLTRKELENAVFPYNISNAEKAVTSSVTAPLTQSQYDALVSIAYNRGIGAFRTGGLVESINANPKNLFAIEPLMLRSFSNVAVAGALRNRRIREYNMYKQGTISEAPQFQKKTAPWYKSLGIAAAITGVIFSLTKIKQ